MDKTFFTATKEKAYITFAFVGARLILGYLNRVQIATKAPFFVNMILVAIDLIVSLPMKIIFATPFARKIIPAQIFITVTFVLLLVYWYIFACILWRTYDTLNKQDADEDAKKEPPKEDLQTKLSV